MTILENRPISDRERAVVAWLLANAPVNAPLEHLLPRVPELRVVGRCDCGCASVDFEVDGQSGGSHPIADAYAASSTGLKCGLILWGRDGAITGLEIYEMDLGTTRELPSIDKLRTWDQPE